MNMSKIVGMGAKTVVEKDETSNEELELLKAENEMLKAKIAELELLKAKK